MRIRTIKTPNTVQYAIIQDITKMAKEQPKFMKILVTSKSLSNELEMKTL